jgi:hypothetical protein
MCQSNLPSLAGLVADFIIHDVTQEFAVLLSGRVFGSDHQVLQRALYQSCCLHLLLQRRKRGLLRSLNLEGTIMINSISLYAKLHTGVRRYVCVGGRAGSGWGSVRIVGGITGCMFSSDDNSGGERGRAGGSCSRAGPGFGGRLLPIIRSRVNVDTFSVTC